MIAFRPREWLNPRERYDYRSHSHAEGSVGELSGSNSFILVIGRVRSLAWMSPEPSNCRMPDTRGPLATVTSFARDGLIG